MNDTGIKEKVLSEICNLAHMHHIQRVLLFGSRARGDFSATSDIDIAVEGGNYEICFEQSCKAIKEILHENGYAESQTGSPRQILKTAYQAGMIKNEDLWLSALVTRNNVAHAYNKSIALDIVHATKNHFYSMFVELKEEIEKNWL